MTTTGALWAAGARGCPGAMASGHFIVTNWWQWILDAHKAGMSRADILWILKIVGVLEQMQEIAARNDTEAHHEEICRSARN